MTNRQEDNNSGQRRRQNSKSEGQFLPPFLLGFFVALLLVFIPTLSGYLWVCGDVDLRNDEKSTCPRLVRKVPQETRRGLLKKLVGKRLKKQERKEELLILKQDPRESACQIVAGAWSSIWRRKENTEESYCTPEIIDEETLGENHATTISHDEFRTAYTTEFLQLTTEQKEIVLGLGQRVDNNVNNWKYRASQVPWGGQSGTAWFAPSKSTGAAELELLDGGSMFYSYLRIMKWPSQLVSHFPFKLCAKGCGSERAVEHTLEFREKFKPWVVSPSTIKENTHGCIFHHGFSPPYNADEKGSHSLVSVSKRLKILLVDSF
jgi:hypothetical protein